MVFAGPVNAISLGSRTMFDALRPGTPDRPFWPALLVIGLIGTTGMGLMLAMID